VSTPIVVTFTLRRDEYASAIRQNMLRAKMILLVLAILVYMGISPFVTYVLKHSENPAFAFPRSGLAYTVACFSMITYLVWVAPILAVRRFGARDQEQSFRFSEETASSGHATFDWKSCVKVRETGRFFFLYPGAKVMHILPKRAFASTADLDAFRELVTRKLNRT
jgi:hypothetical protein